MSTSVYTEFRSQYATAQATAVELMEQVRDAARYLATQHHYSLTVFAKVTGLHKNSVMRLKDAEWLPRPETLAMLEKLVGRAAAKKKGVTFPDEIIRRGRPAAVKAPPPKAAKANGKRKPARKMAARGRK